MPAEQPVPHEENGDTEVKPAAHREQTLWALVAVYFPAAQSEHAVGATLPVSELSFPAVHCRHNDWLATFWYFPVSQRPQLDCPSVPA